MNVFTFFADLIKYKFFLIFKSLSIIILCGENFSRPGKRQLNLGLSEFAVLYDINKP